MINRIVQAFTTPQYQMTAIDGLIVGLTITIPLVIIYLTIYWYFIRN